MLSLCFISSSQINYFMTSIPDNQASIKDVDKSSCDAPRNTDIAFVSKADTKQVPKEINGPKGLEPTRYGDWESKGRCYDF